MFTLKPWQKLALMGIRFDNDPDPEPKPDPDPKPADPKPDDEKKFSQADMDRAIEERLARERRKAEKPKPEDPKPAPKTDEPKTLTDDDVDKRIADALAAKDKELAVERAGDALDKALEGRVYSASAVRKLDLEQFVNEDGKTVDTKKLNEWVEKNTTEGEKPRRRDPSQGGGSAAASGGSVSAGRDLFDNEKNKSKKQKE